jgi:hypothetical protein
MKFLDAFISNETTLTVQNRAALHFNLHRRARLCSAAFVSVTEVASNGATNMSTDVVSWAIYNVRFAPYFIVCIYLLVWESSWCNTTAAYFH